MGRIRKLITPLAVLGIAGVAVRRTTRRVGRKAEAREAALLRRDRILDAVGTGAERLLRFTNGKRLQEFLSLVGEATGTSRAYIFRNDRTEQGELVAGQCYEWVAPGVPAQIDNPDLQAASYADLGMERWREVLSRGGAILGRVEEFPESERRLLEAQNIRSLVVLPIFIGREWWGFIGYDETRRDRAWSRAEIDALRTSAGLVAAAVERDRADERLQELERAWAERRVARAAEWRSRFLAEASRAFGAIVEYDAIFEQLARLAVPALGVCCIVDVVEDDGLRRVAVAHPKNAALAERIHGSVAPRERPSPITKTLESGVPRIVPHMTDRMVREHVPAGEPESRPRSAMVVPLRARGRVVAVMTLLAPVSRRYGSADLSLAEELALRASLALEKARLYDEARRASRVRDEMLAVVSHDLRNPLNTISLSAGLLEATTTFEEEAPRRQLEIIERSVKRADRLIDDLLDVARLESGTLKLEPGPVPSIDVAREALELHRAQASAERERLVDELPERLPEVWADRDRLLQVFGNLLGNAMKFTPEGGRITLGAEPVDGSIRFRVADTGPGIPADQLPRLFDPFWQATRKRGGAGLGLAIVRGIVDAHGGRIHVESEEGVGTTISFTIPTVEAAGRGAGGERRRDAAAD